MIILWVDLKQQDLVRCENYGSSIVDEALAVSLVSYLTSTIPNGIPLVGSYTLCDNRSINTFIMIRPSVITMNIDVSNFKDITCL